MTRSVSTRQVEVGQRIPALKLTSITGETIPVPDPGQVTHLQFRRFAGCPICNLHIHKIANRLGEIEERGIREILIFHSTGTELRKYEGDLPIVVVADPDRTLYRRFGVETSAGSVLRPGAWKAVPRGLWQMLRRAIAGRRAPIPIKPVGGHFGLPADILVASDGTVLAVKYGAHAYDQWSVDEILEHAPAAPASR